MMEKNLQILSVLKERFEDQVLQVEEPYDFLTVTLRHERIAEIIRLLYDDPSTSFRYLTSLCGIHFPERELLGVVYQLHNLQANMRLRLKILFPEKEPVVQSITSIFAGANWMERETYDFFGIQFDGHPDLRRILNVEDMIMFPLRKEFPLEDQVRNDKNDSMFGR